MIGWHDNDKMESAGTPTIAKKPGILRAMDNLDQIVSELEKQASIFEEKLHLVCFPPSPSNPEGTAPAPIEPCPLTVELSVLTKRLVVLRVYYDSIIGRLDL